MLGGGVQVVLENMDVGVVGFVGVKYRVWESGVGGSLGEFDVFLVGSVVFLVLYC